MELSEDDFIVINPEYDEMKYFIENTTLKNDKNIVKILSFNEEYYILKRCIRFPEIAHKYKLKYDEMMETQDEGDIGKYLKVSRFCEIKTFADVLNFIMQIRGYHMIDINSNFTIRNQFINLNIIMKYKVDYIVFSREKRNDIIRFRIEGDAKTTGNVYYSLN